MKPDVSPIRRDLRFNIPRDNINTWHPEGEHVSVFLNTLSMFFPMGERFFIDSVRHYRDSITDSKLLDEVQAFIGQEAMHGREHDDYNHAVAASGLPVDKQEQIVVRVLALARRLPPSLQLGATIALEHYTAMMADGLLSDPEVVKDADPNMRALWTWHAMEETEHKAVAYDVYREAMGNTATAYAVRVTSMTLTSIVFWSLVYPFFVQNISKRGKLTDIKGWRSNLGFHFGRIGFFRKLIPAFIDYYRPGFHPWDHDNSHYLQQMDEFVSEAERLAAAA